MSSKETREKIRLMCEMHAALKSGPNREVTNTTELRQRGIYMETPCLTGEEGSDFCSSHVQCVFRTLSRLLFVSSAAWDAGRLLHRLPSPQVWVVVSLYGTLARSRRTAGKETGGAVLSSA